MVTTSESVFLKEKHSYFRPMRSRENSEHRRDSVRENLDKKKGNLIEVETTETGQVRFPFSFTSFSSKWKKKRIFSLMQENSLSWNLTNHILNNFLYISRVVIPCVNSIRVPTPCFDACRKRRQTLDRRRWVGKLRSKNSFPMPESPSLGASGGVCGPHLANLPRHCVYFFLSLSTMHTNTKKWKAGFV